MLARDMRNRLSEGRRFFHVRAQMPVTNVTEFKYFWQVFVKWLFPCYQREGVKVGLPRLFREGEIKNGRGKKGGDSNEQITDFMTETN